MNKGQMAGFMKKAQEMQKKFEELQEEVAKLEVTGESGAGMVKITMNGKRDVKKVLIDPSILDDKEMLEDLVAAAINDANRKVEAVSAEKMGSLTAGLPGGLGGMNLPF